MSNGVASVYAVDGERAHIDRVKQINMWSIH
jgi:hypothetical protein